MSARDLAGAIGALEAAIGDPRQGLPEDVFRFISRMTPLTNVDLLIQDERRGTLLTWREDEFFGSGWHLPGGIIRYRETWGERVRACAREELDAEVAFDDAPFAIVEGFGDHDTRGHHIALLFRCRLITGPAPARRADTEPPLPGQWRWHTGAPPDLLPAQSAYARFL